jgi:hypothetical protein
MGEARSTYGGERYEGFRWAELNGRDHLGEPDLDERIILRWIFKEIGWDSVVWIDLTQDRDD